MRYEAPNMNPVVCIAGPTASGKSAWAVELAKKFDGEVINADAMQVYSDLKVLSARPDHLEMEGIPHHMFGHIDGSNRYSVGAFQAEVQHIVLDVLARGKLPILVGGTGLYFKSLTHGLAPIPEPSLEAVREAQQILDHDGIGALRQKAEALDPVATSRVLGDDPQRLLRIVNVALGTGKPLSEWQGDTHPVIPNGYWMGAVILPERDALYARINKRFDGMIAQGALSEVEALIKRGLDESLPVMKAIGVPQLRTLVGQAGAEADFHAALEDAKRQTRRFAKRQYTWFRGQAAEWPRIESSADRKVFEDNILRSLHGLKA